MTRMTLDDLVVPDTAAAAGSSLDNVLKCTVYCTSVDKFAAVNTIYARYIPAGPPARVFCAYRPGQGPSTSRWTASPPSDPPPKTRGPAP